MAGDDERRVPVRLVVVIGFVLGTALLGTILVTVGGPSDQSNTIPVTVQTADVQSNVSVTVTETDARGQNTTLTRNLSLAASERREVYAIPAAQLDRVRVAVSLGSGASTTRTLSASGLERVEVLVRATDTVTVSGVRR